MTDQVAEFRPNWISPPGDTVADLLDEQGWSQAEFAERVGYTTKHVNQLIRGKAAITEDTAVRLERVLGGSAQFWLSREAQYREALARVDEKDVLESWAEWLSELPVNQMIEFGWINDGSDKAELVAACLKFFGVASLDAWHSTYTTPIAECYAAFRASSKYEKKLGSVVAWLRQGERRAGELTCNAFNRSRFLAQLDELRALTNHTNPELFVQELVNVCASVGVAVVFEPAPKGCPAAGATKWLTPEKALLMLSLRYKTNDHLWFAFFHEAAHIVHHGKKLLFLEGTGGLSDEAEREANEFAANVLIPPEHAKALPYLRHTHADVEEFARAVGVAPGIVVGRMQHDELLPPSYLNDLKVRYTWRDN
jgi:addiction module HigA family antidote